jgi:hypothetical protein
VANEDKSAQALAIVVKALKDPITRKQFADDPEGTLSNILDDDVKNLKPGVRNFLAGLTYEELRVVSQLEVALEGAKMTVDVGGNVPTLGKL